LPSGERCRRVGYEGAATFHGAPGIPDYIIWVRDVRNQSQMNADEGR